MGLPSMSKSRKRADLQSSELAQFQTPAPHMSDQPAPNAESYSSDPFSIFSEADFEPLGMDLGQLLALSQFTEHLPGIEL